MLKLTGESLDEEGFKRIHLEGTVDQLMDGDYVAGYEISGIASARHDDHDAIRFTLRDSQGARDVGRCVLRTDANRDVLMQFTRVFDESDRLAEFRKWLEHPTPAGYKRVEARQLGVGDVVALEDDDHVDGSWADGGGIIGRARVRMVELVSVDSTEFIGVMKADGSNDDEATQKEFPSGISVLLEWIDADGEMKPKGYGDNWQVDSKELFLVEL